MLSAKQYLQENEITLQSDKGNIILNEIYFGQIPELLVIEELFDKFKTSYKKLDITKNPRDFREMLADPILKKIGEKIAEAFGFKDVCVSVSKDTYINAYTMGIPVNSKGESYDETEVPFSYEHLVGSVVMTNSGFKFDKRKFKINMLVCLTYGILFKSDITTKELIAVLLHEIGHTFSKVIYNHKLLTGRVDEKFADNFAMMYGYSEYLVSAFTKMGYNYTEGEKVLKQIPLIGGLVGLQKAFNIMMYRTFNDDPHPTIYRRIEDQIKSLEYELKEDKTIPPEMKKDIQDQIDRSKQILNNFRSEQPNEDLTDMIMRKTNTDWAPNHPFEKSRDETADKVSSPEKINKRIGKIYHKKGFFR